MLPDGPALLAFAIASIALILTPGPDQLLIAARAVGQGREAGVVASLGIGAGLIIHIFAAALGIAALVAALPLALDLIRYAGAAYLLWLGIRLVRARPEEAEAIVAARAPLWAVFRQGVVTNLLNPKIVLFFLAFLPQFVTPETPHPALRMIILGAAFSVAGTLWNIVVAYSAGAAGAWMRRRPRVRKFQERFTGAVFIALAARLALPERV
jgi:RhtB (resistance to homoserine/threonine) family protein